MKKPQQTLFYAHTKQGEGTHSEALLLHLSHLLPLCSSTHIEVNSNLKINIVGKVIYQVRNG